MLRDKNWMSFYPTTRLTSEARELRVGGNYQNTQMRGWPKRRSSRCCLRLFEGQRRCRFRYCPTPMQVSGLSFSCAPSRTQSMRRKNSKSYQTSLGKVENRSLATPGLVTERRSLPQTLLTDCHSDARVVTVSRSSITRSPPRLLGYEISFAEKQLLVLDAEFSGHHTTAHSSILQQAALMYCGCCCLDDQDGKI